jgi:hypothetical protein
MDYRQCRLDEKHESTMYPSFCVGLYLTWYLIIHLRYLMVLISTVSHMLAQDPCSLPPSPYFLSQLSPPSPYPLAHPHIPSLHSPAHPYIPHPPSHPHVTLLFPCPISCILAESPCLPSPPLNSMSTCSPPPLPHPHPLSPCPPPPCPHPHVNAKTCIQKK